MRHEPVSNSCRGNTYIYRQPARYFKWNTIRNRRGGQYHCGRLLLAFENKKDSPRGNVLLSRTFLFLPPL